MNRKLLFSIAKYLWCIWVGYGMSVLLAQNIYDWRPLVFVVGLCVFIDLHDCIIRKQLKEKVIGMLKKEEKNNGI